MIKCWWQNSLISQVYCDLFLSFISPGRTRRMSYEDRENVKQNKQINQYEIINRDIKYGEMKQKMKRQIQTGHSWQKLSLLFIFWEPSVRKPIYVYREQAYITRSYGVNFATDVSLCIYLCV